MTELLRGPAQRGEADTRNCRAGERASGPDRCGHGNLLLVHIFIRGGGGGRHGMETRARESAPCPARRFATVPRTRRGADERAGEGEDLRFVCPPAARRQRLMYRPGVVGAGVRFVTRPMYGAVTPAYAA